MSYILDALKKAEHERQQGSVPTLQTSVFEAATPRKSHSTLAYAVAGVALAIGGLALGLYQPWRNTTPATQPATAGALPAPVAPPATVLASPAAPRPGIAAPLPTAPLPPAPTSQSPAPQTLPATPPVVAPATPVAEVLPTLDSLPANLRQGMPALNVLMHAYSSKPQDRLVMINNQALHEGDRLTPELVLERIVPDGMVFNYRGTRFKTGVK